MLEYVKPIIDAFSVKESFGGSAPYFTCISYAPSNGCNSGIGEGCSDGVSNQAICYSDSTQCNGGDVYDNSLCKDSEECECSSTGSYVECITTT